MNLIPVRVQLATTAADNGDVDPENTRRSVPLEPTGTTRSNRPAHNPILMQTTLLKLLRRQLGICALPLVLLPPGLPAAQTPPPIQWQASFGGDAEENCHVAAATSDGGFLLGGDSDSGISGNKTAARYGAFDGWLVKVDADGTRLWDKSFGGDGSDFIEALAVTRDGGALLGLGSYSGASGNKTSPNYGAADYWLVRVDANGDKLWEKSYGGSDIDIPVAALSAADGGFLVAGMSRSPASGNKTSDNYGGFDLWLVRVDANGDKLWDQTYGGTRADGTDANLSLLIFSLVPAGDGGFLIGAPSLSRASGNKTSTSYGGADYWLLKVDSNGNKLWDHSYGGSGDDRLFTVAPTSDGGFLLAGDSTSRISGNRTAAREDPSGADAWVVKVDANGTVLWDKAFGRGSSSINQPRIAFSRDGDLFLGTWKACDPLCREADYWLLGIDASGKKSWEQSFGGNLGEYLEGVVATTDGGVLLVGESGSDISGNKTSGNFGAEDFWVLRLAGPPPQLSISLEPSGTHARLSWPATAKGYVLEVASPLPAASAENSWFPVRPSSYEINGDRVSFAAGIQPQGALFRLRRP